ncbi:hypothetical protein SPSIL_009590 [Sporomusa silvacetica DSM 10669]|uniref:Major facilitator superfamily (MFS) profile domain-containing protein n=1 Tax=Sporomusa silvacetica DSM 10669 TaxID=1123289 RepID=A0ABZ3IGQ0_9FIRM|nr:MFS transporter [Sporomusa silvacetica]OZC13081.1 nitrate transporter [Sporomusa silvacetica DSM 10669]
MKELNQEASSYRWVILLIILLTHITLNYIYFQIGGLASLFIPALHLQPNQFAMALSIPMLACAIFGIPAGALSDRFGTKSVITIGLVITVISSFGRIGVNSFGLFLAWTFTLGFGLAFLNANVAKILGAWFPPRQMGMAMGVYAAGAGVGIAVALATSALFQSIQTAFLTSAISVLCVFVLWLLLIKSKPAGVSALPVQPITESLGIVVRSKNVWVGAIAMLFYMGAYVTFSGYLSNALTLAKGINPVLAGLIASALTFAFILGSVFGPMLSSKIGLTKPFLAPTAFIGAICTYLAWTLPFGSFTWIFLIIAGIMFGTSIPLIMTLPMSLPEIGPVYAGTAGGFISTLQMAGAFFVPSYVILPLAGTNVDQVFLYTGIGFLIFGIVLLLLPELGLKAPMDNSKLSMKKM